VPEPERGRYGDFLNACPNKVCSLSLSGRGPLGSSGEGLPRRCALLPKGQERSMGRSDLVSVGLGVMLGLLGARAHTTPRLGLAEPRGSVKPVMGLAGEEEFQLTLEPASLEVGSPGGETVEVGAKLISGLPKGTKALVSVTVVDDKGRVVLPRAVSPLVAVPAASEMDGPPIRIPPLEDGWYEVKGNAAFAEPTSSSEAMASEASSVHLHVENGEVFFVDLEEWNAASEVNLGREVP
jgi:hypothetical protein